ncbi:uncharacterized protein [Panulirus ornatus]|uniref:uncharacterized protein isoform X2 n=1 Tax=Panulirus ornatus TaxID=150431 RepID=UPI003A8B9EEA
MLSNGHGRDVQEADTLVVKDVHARELVAVSSSGCGSHDAMVAVTESCARSSLYDLGDRKLPCISSVVGHLIVLPSSICCCCNSECHLLLTLAASVPGLSCSWNLAHLSGWDHYLQKALTASDSSSCCLAQLSSWAISCKMC